MIANIGPSFSEVLLLVALTAGVVGAFFPKQILRGVCRVCNRVVGLPRKTADSGWDKRSEHRRTMKALER